MSTPPVPRKVLIYATSRRGLLVFDEPDFPDVPLQVPGGTVEPGEDLPAAARREFAEETGLWPSAPFEHLITTPYSYARDGERRTLERSYFHVRVDDPTPVEWMHREETPHDGSPSILFRLHWIDLDRAAASLGLGLGEWVNLIGR